MIIVILATLTSGFLLYHYIPLWITLWKLKQWRRTYSLERHKPIFDKLYENINGFVLSKHARRQHDAFEYTYGEIEFESFIALIAKTHPNSETKFYDLGSGTGKAVIACAMVFEMQEYCGIELFPELYQSSIRPVEQLKNYPDYYDKVLKINLINGDFLNTDFSDATLIFVNATALFGPTWEKLNQYLGEKPQGKIIITTSKKLTTPAFSVCQTTQVMMSWGIVRAFIHTPFEPPKITI